MLKFFIIFSLLFLCSCTTKTIEDVPEIEFTEITYPSFEKVFPKEIEIRIRDLRSDEKRVNSAKLEADLTNVLSNIFRDRGFLVGFGTPWLLNIDVRNTKGQVFKDDFCVLLDSHLEYEKRSLAAKAIGCFQRKEVLGADLGGNIDEAYRMAISKMLNLLNDNIDRVVH